jgi:hypothetical protein
MKRRYLTLFVLLTLILSSATPKASAQSDSGSINGQITDPGGAVIQGARVTITDLGTNGAVSTTTNASGQYAFSTLRDRSSHSGQDFGKHRAPGRFLERLCDRFR